MDYGRVAPLLTKAIQEQQAEINTLKGQNAQLQADANKLCAVEAEQNARLREQQSEIAALKTANENLTAMATDMKALKKTVAAMQDKKNAGMQTAALSNDETEFRVIATEPLRRGRLRT